MLTAAARKCATAKTGDNTEALLRTTLTEHVRLTLKQTAPHAEEPSNPTNWEYLHLIPGHFTQENTRIVTLRAENVNGSVKMTGVQGVVAECCNRQASRGWTKRRNECPGNTHD